MVSLQNSARSFSFSRTTTALWGASCRGWSMVEIFSRLSRFRTK